MTYSVKEIFYTLQGEGHHAGRPAVFCRFAGCNLWTGREQDRSSAVCQFCDTDFVGTDGTAGGKYDDANQLALRIAEHWPKQTNKNSQRFVVCTGGEPLLQLDNALIEALHGRGFEIAVESNGTIAAPKGIDWLCISPKANAQWLQRKGQELKLVWPQTGIALEDVELADFEHFWLQPMDGPERLKNTQTCIEQCLQRPQWHLSVQTHKIIGIR